MENKILTLPFSERELIRVELYQTIESKRIYGQLSFIFGTVWHTGYKIL